MSSGMKEMWGSFLSKIGSKKRSKKYKDGTPELSAPQEQQQTVLQEPAAPVVGGAPTVVAEQQPSQQGIEDSANVQSEVKGVEDAAGSAEPVSSLKGASASLPRAAQRQQHPGGSSGQQPAISSSLPASAAAAGRQNTASSALHDRMLTQDRLLEALYSNPASTDMGLASLTSTRMSNTAHGDLGAQLFTQPSHVPSGLNTNQLPVRLTQAYGSTDRHSVGSGLPSDEAQHGPSSRMPPAQSRFGPVHAQARASAPGTTTGAPQNGTAGTGEPVSIPAAKGQPPAQRHNLQELLHADYETLDDMQQGQLNQKKHQQPHALQTFLNASASQPGPSTQADTAAEGHASSSKAEAATASAQSAPLPVPLTSSALEQLHNATDSIQPHTQRGHAKKMALVGRWVAAMDLSHAPLEDDIASTAALTPGVFFSHHTAKPEPPAKAAEPVPKPQQPSSQTHAEALAGASKDDHAKTAAAVAGTVVDSSKPHLFNASPLSIQVLNNRLQQQQSGGAAAPGQMHQEQDAGGASTALAIATKSGGNNNAGGSDPSSLDTANATSASHAAASLSRNNTSVAAQQSASTRPSGSHAVAAAASSRTKTIAIASHCMEDLLSPNWTIDDFSLLRKLYEGSLSVVCQAQHKRSGRHIALKIYKRSRLHEMERFQLAREICLHIRIQHPHVVALLAAWKDSKYVYLALEWAPRGNLFDYLVSRGGRLSEHEAAVVVVRPLLAALAFLHAQQFIHRDVKLENIVLDASCCIKLADFGLAIDLKFERANTRLGTFGYFAPEVLDCPLKKGPFDFKEAIAPQAAAAAGSAAARSGSAGADGVPAATPAVPGYDCKVDVWSAGVVAYELLTGKAPFSASSAAKIIDAIRNRQLEYPESLSPPAKDFLSKALTRDPKQRPSAAELLAHPWLVMHCGTAAAVDGALAPQQLHVQAQVQAPPTTAAAAITAAGTSQLGPAGPAVTPAPQQQPVAATASAPPPISVAAAAPPPPAEQ